MSGKAYNFNTTPTGGEALLTKTQQVIEVKTHQTSLVAELIC